MTPLEKRLIEDMKLFGYSKRTQDTYLYAVRKITTHFQTSPDQITNEQLREYLLWHKDKYAPNTTTIALCGIKFFYQKILKKPMPVFGMFISGWIQFLKKLLGPDMKDIICLFPAVQKQKGFYIWIATRPTEMISCIFMLKLQTACLVLTGYTLTRYPQNTTCRNWMILTI